ncbi:MAG: GNAT family N-acetyltransferase [Bacilli bacterium]|nr:GNAT family N-acetyltransferase [Bacilli bacterium]
MRYDLYEMFKNNFPYIYRERETIKSIINNKNNKYIEKRNKKDELIGLSIINNNTILLLCVDSKYRNKGIGSKLLEESERLIISDGYDNAVLGVGFNYLMPGIPTSKHYFKSEHENLYPIISDTAESFFINRGYINNSECDFFDMGQDLDIFNYIEHKIGDSINNIEYRFATINDIDNICLCTDDAQESFTKYYKIKDRYNSNSKSRVLIATINDEVAGTIIMSLETEGKKVGSLGCATTKHKYRNNHIAVNLTNLATKWLKDNGMKYAHLNYTYTGLDHVYGYAGYEICVYYSKAEKPLKRKNKKTK